MSTDHRLRLPHASEGFGPPPLGSMGPLGLPAPVPNLSHSRLWHSSPVHPAGQRQRPVRRSQRPPWRHVQRCWQPAPKRPGGHSAGAGTGKGPTSWGGTQEPPPRPRFPHPEPRTPRPRKGEVEAPVPLQVRGHTAGQCSPPPGSRLRPQRRGLDQARWAAGLAPTDPQRPLLASACPALTLLTGQAGPALGAGAVARDGVAGAPVLAEAGLPAALAMQALGAGWETERAARCSTRQPGPQGPRAPLGRASAKTSVGPGSETSPRTTSPRPPGPTSPAVLGTMHHLPGPRPSPRQVLHPSRVPGDPAGPSEGGAHPSREVGMAYPAGSWGLSSQGHSNTVHGLGHRRPHGSRCKPGCSCAHR